MAGCRKKHSATQKNNFKQYALENRAVINRVKRLGSMLKNETNETKISELRAAINKAHFRRKKPKQSTLTNDTKARLNIIKFFTGKGNKELISATKEQHGKAWETLLATKRKGKIPTDIARLRVMSIGENLPDSTKKNLQILRNNLQKAA